MHLDGLYAQAQVPGDVARAIALANQLEDFKLAVGQSFDGRSRCLAVPEKFSRMRADIFSLT